MSRVQRRGGDAATGRPARFCSDYCRNFAARKRREARSLLECARTHDDYAEQAAAGTLTMFGSAEYLRKRADELRAGAATVLAEIGEAA